MDQEKINKNETKTYVGAGHENTQLSKNQGVSIAPPPLNLTNGSKNAIQKKEKEEEKEEENIQRKEMAPPSGNLVQRQVIQLTAEEDRRRRLAHITENLLMFVPVVNLAAVTLRAIGLQVTGIAVGLRESASVGAGIGGGVGIDEMFFLDLTTLRPSGDVIPYAEVGLGIRVDASVSGVVAIRVSPTGNYGRMSSAYAGGSVGGSAAFLGRFGFSIGTGAFTGGEFFVSMTIGAGAAVGASFSGSYGVSASETLRSMDGRTSSLRLELVMPDPLGGFAVRSARWPGIPAPVQQEMRRNNLTHIQTYHPDLSIKIITREWELFSGESYFYFSQTNAGLNSPQVDTGDCEIFLNRLARNDRNAGQDLNSHQGAIIGAILLCNRIRQMPVGRLGGIEFD